MQKNSKIIIALLAALVVVGIVLAIVLPLTLGRSCEDPAPAPHGPHEFPEDFKFGAATSSYQIEGGYNQDGKSDSIWDTLTRSLPDTIRNGDNGNIAADSYYRYEEDIKALKDTGLDFYRFSISWPRIQPNGVRRNQAGIDYYNTLINLLIEEGIEPMVTIYHWDLPQWLQDFGGWTNPVIIDYYVDYVDVLYEAFGDRVKKWITFNEPYIFCHYGYGLGTHAPLIFSPGIGDYECAHNVLLSHARAYHLYQDNYAETQDGEVGISLYTAYFYPGYNADQALAVQAVEHMLGWFANPIFSENGNYPQVMIDNVKRNSEAEGRTVSRLPEFTADEIESLKGSSDFLALNYYTSRYVKHKENYPDEYDWESDAGIDQFVDPRWPKAKSDFLYSVPGGLHDILDWASHTYNNPPIWITENGWSDDGEIEDLNRITYIREHLHAILESMEHGTDVRGYAVWSIIDNFEWLAGYSEKFGIYHVDFTRANRVRTPKLSSSYLRNVTATRMI